MRDAARERDPLAAALAYAVRGWPVFPCREQGERVKAPYLPGETSPGARDGGHWLASADAATVAGWWRRWPGALIGLPTGRRTCSVVIDLDPKEHAPDIMLAALAAFAGPLTVTTEDGEIIEPALARTQSGGLHVWFRYPSASALALVGVEQRRRGREPDGQIGNRTGLFRQQIKRGGAPETLANVDVRGEGGYVIAPPSVLANGRAYAWLGAPPATLPPLPPRLLARIADIDGAPAQPRERQGSRFTARDIADERVRRYVERTVRGILNAAASAPEGNRNAAVFWAACRLGEFVLGRQIDRGEAESLLLAHLPAGVIPTEKKIIGTIRNGLTHRDLRAWSPDMMRERA